MDFKLVSDDSKRIQINMDLVNIYTGRYKAGTPYDVSVTRRQAKKSDPMRRFYFATVLPPFMEELGYDISESKFFHQQLKIRYFERHPLFLDENGKTIIKKDKRGMWQNVPKVFRKESMLDVSVKKQFVDWVRQKAAEYGIYTEDPGE